MDGNMRELEEIYQYQVSMECHCQWGLGIGVHVGVLSHKCFMRERITENSRVQFPVGTKVWRGHLVYVASGITSRRTKQLYSTLAKGGRPAFLPGTEPLRGL